MDVHAQYYVLLMAGKLPYHIADLELLVLPLPLFVKLDLET